MKTSFPPIADNKSRILILGSLPGEMSLEKSEYYAHPRNVFWRIMCNIFSGQYVEDYQKRCEMLLQNKIALWDVVHSAERKGSLDTAIKDETVNNLIDFLYRHKGVNKILLNGGKAAVLFKRHCKDIKIETISLPSTSPANAGMRYDEKLRLWREAIENTEAL